MMTSHFTALFIARGALRIKNQLVSNSVTGVKKFVEQKYYATAATTTTTNRQIEDETLSNAFASEKVIQMVKPHHEH